MANTDIPDGEETLKELLKKQYAAATYTTAAKQKIEEIRAANVAQQASQHSIIGATNAKNPYRGKILSTYPYPTPPTALQQAEDRKKQIEEVIRALSDRVARELVECGLPEPGPKDIEVTVSELTSATGIKNNICVTMKYKTPKGCIVMSERFQIPE